jgi:hypothetical protein
MNKNLSCCQSGCDDCPFGFLKKTCLDPTYPKEMQIPLDDLDKLESEQELDQFYNEPEDEIGQ